MCSYIFSNTHTNSTYDTVNCSALVADTYIVDEDKIVCYDNCFVDRKQLWTQKAKAFQYCVSHVYIGVCVCTVSASVKQFSLTFSNIAVLTESFYLEETFLAVHAWKGQSISQSPFSFCNYQIQQFVITVVLVLLNHCSGPLSVRFVNMDMMCEHVVCKQVCEWQVHTHTFVDTK